MTRLDAHNYYIPNLGKICELLGKSFRDADEQDIRRIVSIIESNERYSPWTKRDYKLTLRKFFTWRRGTKEYPSEVAWLRVQTKIKCSKTHEDMLTEEEVKRLIAYARTIQERAFISVLYESGCRRVRVVACAPILWTGLTNILSRTNLKRISG